jgi:predicted permease
LPGWQFMPDLGHDLHQGARLIRRNPGYAIVAMLCLSLGIGVNSTVFSLLDGMYFRLLPVPRPDRIMAIDREGGMPMFWRDYMPMRAGLRAFDSLAASQLRGTFMDVERANFGIQVETVSLNYADTLGLKAAIGRWFLPSDESPGAESSLVISGGIWAARFQRSPGVIGQRVRVEDQWYRIVGVAPDEFRGTSPPVRTDVWVPLTTFPIFRPQLRDSLSPGPEVALIGRLAPGQTVEHAAAEIRVRDARLRQSYPGLRQYNAAMRVRVFRGIVSGESRRRLRPIAWLSLAVVGIVLLIACVNVANLLLSRAVVRRQEMALRRSLGATPSRLVRQGLAEGMLLALGGAILGIVFGYWTDRALSAWLPASLPESLIRGIELEMNWRVAAFTAVAALVCAVLFSPAPSLESSTVDLFAAMKSDVAFGRSRRWRQRDLYVVAQVALSLVLLIGAALLLRALKRTSEISPGFATDHRIYIRLFTPRRDFTPDSSTRLFSRLLDDARALPGVQDVTLSFDVLGFMDGECATLDRASPPAHAAINVVEPNYFQLMQVPLLRGRNFAAYDRPQSPRVVIVNQTMAAQRWPGQDPVGKEVWLGCGEDASRVRAQVIGVTRDSKYGALDERGVPLFYVSRLQVWWNGFFALILKTRDDPRAVMEPLIQLARSGGPNLRIYELRSFDELLRLSLWRIRWQARLLGTFSLLAIVLSAIGLYGVVAYTVAQRTREIGIRMALGAQKGDVQWMVLAHGLRLSAAGILAGLAISGVVMRLLRGFLYGVSPLDPVAFAGTAMAWLLIAMLASSIPARRAARVDPAISLGHA